MGEFRVGQTGLVDLKSQGPDDPRIRGWGTVTEVDPSTGALTLQLFTGHYGQTTVTVPPNRFTVAGGS